MMKKLFILACVCLLITSCNSNSKNTNDSAISTETTDMHNAENSLDMTVLTPELFRLPTVRVST